MMEAVLVSRNSTTDDHDNLTTSDSTLQVTLTPTALRRTVETVPASEWNLGIHSQGSHPGVARERLATEIASKVHALTGFSAFGADEPNEFATFVQGRETHKSNNDLREELEDDWRSFAEKSDHTEGFMLTSNISDGFGGFTSSWLESLRDEFPKTTLWTTAILGDSKGWKRTDTDRSKFQRLINEALSLQNFEELSSMVLPVQPPPIPISHSSRPWDGNSPWSRYLRDDLDQSAVYAQVLNQHLQSANSELREPDSLTQIVQQLNWRGDNKIASLSGISPILPADFYSGGGAEGLQRLKKSWKDWSVLPLTEQDLEKGKRRKEWEETPFAQYSVVRGFEFEESQALGPLLEASTALKEPLSQWVSLPQPYPILPSSTILPIYRGLLPNGRPLVLSQPSLSDPHTSGGLFGLPDTRFPLPSSYVVQPRSVPILTTLSTRPSTRHWLNHLHSRLKEFVRTKYRGLREYEEGEFGIGREGVLECLERIETLMDNYRSGVEDDDEEEQRGGDFVDKDEDENWDDTEDTWDL